MNARNMYISSPVSNATSAVFDAAGTNIMYSYNENNNTWTEITDNTTLLDVLIGYIANISPAGSFNFSGSLNTGNMSISNLSRTASSSKKGFHLLGNPYLSSLEWDTTTATNLTNTIWYRTVNNSSTFVFDTYNAASMVGTNNNQKGAVTKHIPPMQAFWVRVKTPDGSTGSLATTNSLRSHQTNYTMDANSEQANFMRIKVNFKGNTDEAIILFDSQALDTYESWDSEKMFSSGTKLPQIYTEISGSGSMVINSLHGLNGPLDIPLGFKTDTASDFNIYADLSSFNPNTSIYLEDLQTGTTTNLRTTGFYSFSSIITNTISRFILHLNPATISGQVVYADSQNTPMAGCLLTLENYDGNVIETTITDGSGNYVFTETASGIMKIKVTNPNPAGGFNSVDALLSLRHFVQLSTLTGIQLLAADVNKSSSINSIDGLLIAERFTGIMNSFPAGEWIFPETTVQVASPGQQVNQVIQGLCYGDINASFFVVQ